MTNAIIKCLCSIAITAMLASCGGGNSPASVNDDIKTQTELAAKQGLIFSYPRQNQAEFNTSAPIVLRFTSAIDDANPEDLITLRDAQGATVAYSIKSVGTLGLVLTPTQSLSPAAEYSLEVSDRPTDCDTTATEDCKLTLADGAMNSITINFSTRALHEGSPGEVVKDADFTVQRMIPDGTDVTMPVLDFATFRIQFNQPIDRNTVNYGTAATDISLKDAAGTLVDATVIIGDSYLTLDPNVDLTPGEEYTISLSSAIGSVYGYSLTATEFTITPQDSVSRSSLVLELESGSDSNLTGDPINLIPLDLVLLGSNEIQTSGNLGAELAHLPTFPDTGPLRIKKGALIAGSSIELKVGGEVPLGFDSGDVSLHFISDATGYMIANPYSDLDEAPRQIVLFMDIALTAANPRASGAVTQNIMHLELVGTAIVEDGRFNINAVSMAEIRVLGAEDTNSLLTFNMRSYHDLHNAPDIEDTTAPTVHAWVEDDVPGIYRPGDAIVLHFSEPLDMASIVAGESLILTDTTDSTAVSFRFYQHGSALVLQPDSPLESGHTYSTAFNGVTDAAGNAVTSESQVLEVPEFVETDPQSPVILSMYPGYPCVLVDADLIDDDKGVLDDIDERTAGRCDGGAMDDLMPIPRLPVNRPIRVAFTQNMDPTSINSNTLVVEWDKNGDSSVYELVAGQINVENRALTFVPDQPFVAGSSYRYTLKSAVTVTAGDCGTEAICDLRGLPLQTTLLTQTQGAGPAPTDGGDDLVTYFDAVALTPVDFDPVATTTGVMQYLSALPTADVNANFKRDSGEAVVSATPQAAMNSARLARHPEGNLFHDENAENVVLFDEDGNALFEEDGVTPLLAKNGIPKRRNSDGNPIDQNGDVIRTLKKDGNGDVIQGDLLLDVNGNLIEGFPVTITDSQVLNRLVAEVADGFPVVDVTSGSGRAVWDSNVGCGFDENDAPLDCPDDTYLHMSSSLNADIIGYLSPAQIEERYGDDSSIPSDVAEQGAVLTYIYPSQLILSSASVYVTVKPAFTAACKPADQGGGTTCYVVPPVETGPMVMRIRYDCDVGENDCGAPDYGRVKGWIVEDKDTGTSIFKTSLNLYLDAPALDPIVNQLLFGDENSLFELETIHNLYSRQVSLDLSGKLDILPDGRLNVELLSTTSLDIDILLEVIGFTGVTLYETEHVYLTVPAGGVNLSLTSEPIKP